MTNAATYRILYLPLTFTFFFGLSVSAGAQQLCGMKSGADSYQLSKEQGESTIVEARSGMHVPSKGTLKGLVVFIQTRGDQVDDSSWPIGQLPNWGPRIVADISRYFWTMSNGMLDLELDLYPDLVVTNLKEEEYITYGISHGEMMKEIARFLDSKLDFSEYDHWVSQDRAFRVVEGTDKKVDLVFFFHRSISNRNWMPFTGVSDMNFKGFQFIDGNQRYFYGGSGFNNDAGSTGLIVAGYPGSGSALFYDEAFRIGIHEFMHKLYGDTHLTDVFAGLGLHSGNSSGFGMTAYERHALGYIDLTPLPKQRDTIVTLRDYLTTDDAVSIPIPGANRHFYIIEFRNLTSEYDTAPEKGVYIYRLNDHISALQKTILPISAEGNWHWKRDTATGEIDRDYPDPLSGYSRINKIVIDGKPYWVDGYKGHIGIAFLPKRQPFGVFRNPTPDFLYGSDTIKTNMTITVAAMTDTSATIAITYTPPAMVTVESSLESAFTLGQSYPNPFSSSSGSALTIPFSLECSAAGDLTIFDELGKVVLQHRLPQLEPGSHTLSIETSVLRPGVYFYEMHVSGTAKRRLLIITR